MEVSSEIHLAMFGSLANQDLTATNRVSTTSSAAEANGLPSQPNLTGDRRPLPQHLKLGGWPMTLQPSTMMANSFNA